MRNIKKIKARIKAEEIRSKKRENLSFDQALSKFIMDEPFYSHISTNINKYKTTKLDTAGVTIENDHPVLYYNEKFFEILNWMQQQGLLIHEFLHIILGHITTRVRTRNGKPDKAWYFACDFSINSLIEEKRLPPGGLIPGFWADIPEEYKKLCSQEYIDAYNSFKDMVRKWPKGESAEWYYNKINLNRDAFDKIEKDKKFLIDVHDGWVDNLSTEEKEMLQNSITNMVKDASEICEKNNKWGSVPSELQKRIRKIIEGKISWKDLLKNFVGNSTSVHKISTIKKINKRFPYIHPGKRRKKTAKIVICIDQSGSMDDKSLQILFGELEILSDITEFVVVPFDSEVVKNKIFTWKKGEKLNVNRVAHGATNFDVPTKWVNERFTEFDAAIFMTDGHCFEPRDCLIPRTWIITKRGSLSFDTNDLVIQMS